MFAYEPVNMQSALAAVNREHPLDIDTDHTEHNNQMLRLLIERINEQPVEKLDSFALSLHSTEIEALCEYVPVNSMNLNIIKPLRIIGRRITKKRFRVYYSSWQQNYRNKYCCMMLREIAESALEKELLEQFHLNNGILLSWLDSESIEQEVIKSVQSHGVSFSAGCEFYGLKAGGKLANQCRYFLNSRQLPGITYH